LLFYSEKIKLKTVFRINEEAVYTPSSTQGLVGSRGYDICVLKWRRQQPFRRCVPCQPLV